MLYLVIILCVIGCSLGIVKNVISMKRTDANVNWIIYFSNLLCNLSCLGIIAYKDGEEKFLIIGIIFIIEYCNSLIRRRYALENASKTIIDGINQISKKK